MSRTVSFHELAERELNDAAGYYERQARGLGSDFLAAVDAALSLVLENPEIGVAVQGGIRRIVVARFPYALFYSLPPNAFRILAVSHQRRRPFYWRSRR